MAAAAPAVVATESSEPGLLSMVLAPLPVCRSKRLLCRRQSTPSCSSAVSVMSMMLALISSTAGRLSSDSISDWCAAMRSARSRTSTELLRGSARMMGVPLRSSSSSARRRVSPEGGGAYGVLLPAYWPTPPGGSGDLPPTLDSARVPPRPALASPGATLSRRRSCMRGTVGLSDAPSPPYMLFRMDATPRMLTDCPLTVTRWSVAHA